ncbi:FadR/GntR family transcriptional regulator [Streptomyces sp. NPDC059740]|uniref:FadR/GntR family transcriptional regulator n=1 Tax=Streptomyces sp. NPDC059740 TaxID=3346926 RepID=UPI003653563F
MELQGLHGQVVDRIGAALVADTASAGTVLRLEDVQERYGVSRTVAREAVRVLESKRAVTSRPRVGITVRPLERWNLYDPQVIRWRLASPGREEQLRELAELRAAVEPAAAGLAAVCAPEAARGELLRLAEEMRQAADEEDRDRFIDADSVFHRTLLAASGNAMFAQLAEVTEELLVSRGELALMPEHIDMTAVAAHRAVAEAVAAGRSADAAARAHTVVARARGEVERILDVP